MTQRTLVAGTTVPQGHGSWTLAKALAPLLRPWREPRPLYPDQLSDYWRRDLGLPERDGRDIEPSLSTWVHLERW